MTPVRRLTPPGQGGVAVVSLEGPDARERLGRLTPSPPPPPGGLALVRLVDPGGDGETPLDEALVVARGPDHLELHLHGGPALVEAVLEGLGAPPPPPPRTLEERARERLARAPCELAARILLDQTQGALRGELSRRRPEPGDARDLGARWLRARRLLEPARVVLAGPENAGKSTLFNLLVGERRVAVAGEGGTTRDTILAPALLGPYPVELVDTAGEQRADGGADGGDDLVRGGRALARAVAERADLILWLAPPGVDAPPPDRSVPRVVLRSKADLEPSSPETGSPQTGPAALSALASPEGARQTVERAFLGALDLASADLWVPGRAVPFEAPLAQALGAAFAHPPGPARDRALEFLLAGGAA